MQAEIIVIGNEILQGRTQDTNSGWLAGELFEIGLDVSLISVVPDRQEAISTAIDTAGKRADVVLLTGGLGPTSDDMTTEVLASCFDDHLVFNEDVFRDIRGFLERRGTADVSELNRQQAYVPSGCAVIPNDVGTAPGLWFERDDTIVVAMPGVPFEMRRMVERHIVPRLKNTLALPVVVQRTALTHGVPEAMLAARLSDWETSLRGGLSLAYLPSPGSVRVRLTARGSERASVSALVNDRMKALAKILGDDIFGYDDDRLETVVGDLLAARGATVATAESCTGGSIARLLTAVPGSSQYYRGSIVAYANDVKAAHLGVDSVTIEAHGAVSREVVTAMAAGVRDRMGCDYAVATSGVAGPDGGTPDKPVGTVWIAAATDKKITAKRFQFGELRHINIEKSAYAALNLLRKAIIETGQERRHG